MQGIRLRHALEAAGYTPDQLWAMISDCGMRRFDFYHKYLNKYEPERGMYWDAIIRQLDAWGIDW